MIDDETPPAAKGSVYGHNSGSMLEAARSEQAAALHDTPRDGGKTFADRKAEFLLSASRQTVTNRDAVRSAADTIKLASEVWDQIDADRRKRSDPFYEAHRALSAMATEFWAPVEAEMQKLREGIDAWTAEEDRRVADDRAEQAAIMAKMRGQSAPAAQPAPRPHVDYADPAPAPRTVAPAMKPAKRARIHGDLGSVVSQVEKVIYEVEDVTKVPAHILNTPVVHEAILAVVRQTAKHFGVPDGIRATNSTGNQIR